MAIVDIGDGRHALKLNYELQIAHLELPLLQQYATTCVGSYGKPAGMPWEVVRVARQLPVILEIKVVVPRRTGRKSCRWMKYTENYFLSGAEATLGGMASCMDRISAADLDEHFLRAC